MEVSNLSLFRQHQSVLHVSLFGQHYTHSQPYATYAEISLYTPLLQSLDLPLSTGFRILYILSVINPTCLKCVHNSVLECNNCTSDCTYIAMFCSASLLLHSQTKSQCCDISPLTTLTHITFYGCRSCYRVFNVHVKGMFL